MGCRVGTWVRFAAGLALASAVAAGAQDGRTPPAGEPTGAIGRAKDARAVRIGFREGAIPFAFAGRDGTAYGYSIDICQAIVEEIARVAGEASLRVEYVRVTSEDRVRQVADGRVDLECGATTGTAERRELVDFSPLIYVAGTRLLVKRGGAIRSERDLAGRAVAVARGSTNEAAMSALAGRPGGAFGVEVADDIDQALGRLASGAVDAIAADDVLIAGFLATRDLRGAYAMVGAPLSHEPYGIMFARGDAALKEAVGAAIRRLAVTGEIRRIHDKWFLRELPSGVRLGIPMGRELERAFELQGLPPR